MIGRCQHLGLVLGAALCAASVVGQTPPSDLHRVDDHWTAWNPPASLPEGSDVYVIQTGDTLWELAAQFLGDSHLWPQIWEQNQYILDAHWIYPGDPLLLPGSMPSEIAASEIAAPPLDEGTTDPFAEALSEVGLRPPTAEAPVPIGHESDIYCSGFVADESRDFPFEVTGSEFEYLNPVIDPDAPGAPRAIFAAAGQTQKYGLGVGDILYLSGGLADGLAPGELLTAVASDRVIRHPDTGKRFGRYYRYLGRIRVLSTQEDSSIGEIVMSCDPIPIGSKVQRFEPEPVPLRRLSPLRPVNIPASSEEIAGNPTIIGSRDNLITLGTGTLVFVDAGIEDGAAPGDVFTVYRRTPEGAPNVVVGELGLLAVYESTALAKILKSRYSLYVGDVLDPK